MRHRKPTGTKVSSASKTMVLRVNAPESHSDRIKRYLRELGMDVREYNKKAAMRLEMRQIEKGFISVPSFS